MPDGVTKAQPRDPGQIQAEIAQARDEIASSVLALRERMSEATDWREWVRRRPYLLLACALATGAWLGFRRAQRQ